MFCDKLRNPLKTPGLRLRWRNISERFNSRQVTADKELNPGHGRTKDETVSFWEELDGRPAGRPGARWRAQASVLTKRTKRFEGNKKKRGNLAELWKSLVLTSVAPRFRVHSKTAIFSTTIQMQSPTSRLIFEDAATYARKR
jgi:hypothetical protein